MATVNPLPISSMVDFVKIGEQLAASGFFGELYPAQGFAIAVGCHQEDISYEQFRRTYHIIEGKPSMRADTMLARLLEMGGDYKVIERTNTVAHIKAKRAGGEPFEVRFTMEQAIEMGLPFKAGGKQMKRNWRVHPANMLWARAASEVVRVVEPRVNYGIYTPEELEGDDDAPNSISGDPVPCANPPAVPADPFAPLPQSAVDYDLVPFGPNAGKRWFDLGHDTLKAVLADPKTLTREHLDAVKAALEKLPY